MTDGGAPRRVKRERTKGWKMPENTVNVTRPGKWGNPFRVGRDGTAEECVAKYRGIVFNNLWTFPTKDDCKTFLRGKNLMCFCALDQPCHADVLLELANK